MQIRIFRQVFFIKFPTINLHSATLQTWLLYENRLNGNIGSSAVVTYVAATKKKKKIGWKSFHRPPYDFVDDVVCVQKWCCEQENIVIIAIIIIITIIISNARTSPEMIWILRRSNSTNIRYIIYFSFLSRGIFYDFLFIIRE